MAFPGSSNFSRPLSQPVGRGTRQGNRGTPFGQSTGTGLKPAQRAQQKGFNLPLLLITGAVGVASWGVGSLLYNALVDTMPRALLIGLLFAGLCLVLCAVVCIFSKLKGIFQDSALFGGGINSILLLAAGVVIVFLAGMLLQWLYGLNAGRQTSEPTSYIFIIDDSGSMAVNDPEGKRYRAIPDVLADTPDSFPYMVYGFASSSGILRPMAPKGTTVEVLSGNSNGGTEMRAVLNRVINDCQSGVWDGGENPKVILLTDGYATDIGIFTSMNRVLRPYKQAHISISTVGLGDVDEQLMKRIAKSTGGVFVDVSNASGLSGAMQSAATTYATRDLLSTRYMHSLHVLYGFLRVLFLILLGVGIGLVAMVAYGFADSMSITMLTTGIKAVLGALVMELGTSVFGFSDSWMWLILWILLALTVTVKPVESGRSGASGRMLPPRGIGKTSRIR